MPETKNGTTAIRDRSGVQSVERTLDILEALVDFGTEVGLVEISQAVGLPLATVHRLLGTLSARGYAKQNRQNRKYALGFRALQMGHEMRQRFSLRLEARPFLQRLAQTYEESANLAVLDDGEIVYIDQSQSSRILRMYTQIGNRLPAHSTGSGKAILAFADAQALDGMIARYGLVPRTSRTITEESRFRAELDAIRSRGYAIDDEEQEEGVRCVAVPVRDASGHVVAAISVSGPSSRLSDERIGTLVSDMVDAGRDLSALLGHMAKTDRTT